MDSALFIIGFIGNIVSVFLFLSPIETFWWIVQNGSTEEFYQLPYVLTLLNVLLWLYYGLTKPDGLLIAAVNGFGAIMQAIYVVLFIVYAADHGKRIWTRLAAAVDIAAFGVVFLVTRVAISELDTRIMVIGIICSCLTIFMYASPLAATRRVIDTGSVKYMPFSLSMFLSLNGGIWTVYAVIDRDIFIGIPNGLGFVLGAIQMISCVKYKNSRTSQCSCNEAAEAASSSQASAPLLTAEAAA